MKRRFIAAAIVLAALWILELPLVYDLDVLLSRRNDFLWNPVAAVLPVFRSAAMRKLYLLSALLALLAVAACLTAGSHVYTHSGMQRLTPDIEIPEAAGQGQFGTARFLPRKKYSKAFSAYTLSTDGKYAELLKEGKADVKEID